ncbi:MAG: hypothetical protein ACREOW_17375 [Thermodesulfobacteriota bacterium]
MNRVTQVSTTVALVFATLLIALQSMAQQSGQTGVQLKPGTQAMSKANDPAPPANAKQKSSAGKGSATIGTKNSPTDTDSFWVESIDVDGNGDVETADLLWDDEDKVLLIYYEDDFTCDNGAPGSGGILMGINGADNPRKRPAGSGFYVVSLDEGECGAEEASLWGCKFDATGNETACGVAVLDEKNDDLVIVTASE